MIGLDSKDRRILGLLNKKPLYPSAMARELEEKRTTLAYRLVRLERAGLVKPSVDGRRSFYSLTFKKHGAKNLFQLFTGTDILNAYREFLDLPKQSTILSIQGSGAVVGQLNNLSHDFIKEAHRVFKRKGIIIKGFSNWKSIKAFDRADLSLIQSHIGRSLGLKIFNNDFFTSNGEMMVSKGLLLIANPVIRKAILIKDKEIAQIVYDTISLLFEIMEGTSSFDLNSHLQKTYLSG